MESHWENSSSNSIIKDMIEGATEVTKAEIETLISGGCVEKPIIPELTYTDLDSEDRAIRETYLWSVLYAAGYLTDLEQKTESSTDWSFLIRRFSEYMKTGFPYGFV